MAGPLGPGWGWSRGGDRGLYWTAPRVLGREAWEGPGYWPTGLSEAGLRGGGGGDSHPQAWGGGPQGSCGSPDLVALSKAQGKPLQGQAK